MRRAQQVVQHEAREAQTGSARLDVLDRRPESFGVWLRCDEAQRYVGCRTIKGFYEWKRRHGIVLHNGRISRLELDRALKAVRKPRQMAPASLANLRRRQVA